MRSVGCLQHQCARVGCGRCSLAASGSLRFSVRRSRPFGLCTAAVMTPLKAFPVPAMDLLLSTGLQTTSPLQGRTPASWPLDRARGQASAIRTVDPLCGSPSRLAASAAAREAPRIPSARTPAPSPTRRVVPAPLSGSGTCTSTNPAQHIAASLLPDHEHAAGLQHSGECSQ